MTGSTGFIGSSVLARFLSDGHQVVALLRPDSDTSRLKHLVGFQSVRVDDFASDSLAAEIQKWNPDVFIHLAWRGVSGKERNEAFQVEDNLSLTLDTVRLAKKSGCRHWIGIGSQAEYGNPNRKVAESAPTEPTSIYGMAKLSACWGALGLCKSLGLPASWVRVFSTYGPGDDAAWLIPYLIRELSAGRSPKLTRCEQIWDYLHVRDAADGIVSLALVGAEGIFNLGSGQGVPLRSIVETIQAKVNTGATPEFGAVPYRDDQVMHLEADIEKLSANTGWSPRIGLEEGLRDTIIWYRENGD